MLKKSMTLVELILAIVLLVVIVLGAGTFSLGSRRFLQTSERKTTILNNVNLILDHIDKNVSLAAGDDAISANNGITCDATHLLIRLAIDKDSKQYDRSLADYSNNLMVEYRVSGNTLEFCDNATAFDTCVTTYETLTADLVRNAGQPDDFRFDCVSTDVTLEVNQASVANLVLLYDIGQGYDAISNPKTGMRLVGVPGRIVFNSQLHSAN